MLPIDVWLPLALFVALVLVAALYALAASGHFPREHRAPSLSHGLGAAILFGSMAAVAFCVLAGLVIAWRAVPWYATVIGAGLAILAAPLLLQQCPDRFVDGRASLLSFAAAAVILAPLIWLVA